MIPERLLGDRMRRFVEGADRSQTTLFPECLDDWIDEDNPVRVIDALSMRSIWPSWVRRGRAGGDRPALLSSFGAAEALHLRLSQPGAVEPAAGAGGRPQRRGDVADRAARSRSQDDRRLPQGQRRRHPQGLRAFVALCREMGLFSAGSVAIDGSKFKAVNNRDKNFTRAKVERRRAQIEESVARYLQQLDTADRQEPSDAIATKTTRLKEKIAKLGEEMERWPD